MSRFQEAYRWDGLIKSEVKSMVFSPDGAFLAVASAAGPVFVFATGGGDAKYVIDNPANAVANCLIWAASSTPARLELFVGRSDRCITSYYLNNSVS